MNRLTMVIFLFSQRSLDLLFSCHNQGVVGAVMNSAEGRDADVGREQVTRVRACPSESVRNVRDKLSGTFAMIRTSLEDEPSARQTHHQDDCKHCKENGKCDLFSLRSQISLLPQDNAEENFTRQITIAKTIYMSLLQNPREDRPLLEPPLCRDGDPAG